MDIPKFVMTIIERLERAGFEAYVVGGAVRDLCLKRPVMDWDVATSARPEMISEVFQDVRHFTLKHETVTLVDSDRHYEVTTYRGSGEVNLPIEEDLGHRDFTINAIAYDTKRKHILDPFGGREDIKKKIVRAVGKPEERFREDPLRLIRGVRIAVEHGDERHPPQNPFFPFGIGIAGTDGLRHGRKRATVIKQDNPLSARQRRSSLLRSRPG